MKETECVQELMKAQADLVEFKIKEQKQNINAIKSQRDGCRNLVSVAVIINTETHTQSFFFKFSTYLGFTYFSFVICILHDV